MDENKQCPTEWIVLQPFISMCLLSWSTNSVDYGIWRSFIVGGSITIIWYNSWRISYFWLNEEISDLHLPASYKLSGDINLAQCQVCINPLMAKFFYRYHAIKNVVFDIRSMPWISCCSPSMSLLSLPLYISPFSLLLSHYMKKDINFTLT